MSARWSGARPRRTTSAPTWPTSDRCAAPCPIDGNLYMPVLEALRLLAAGRGSTWTANPAAATAAKLLNESWRHANALSVRVATFLTRSLLRLRRMVGVRLFPVRPAAQTTPLRSIARQFLNYLRRLRRQPQPNQRRSPRRRAGPTGSRVAHALKPLGSLVAERPRPGGRRGYLDLARYLRT